jgi:hypothetical protein
MAHSSLPTARARAIATAASILEARWGGRDGYDFETCMFEALPFAMLGDDVPDALAEYVNVRENLLEHMLEGGNLDTGASDWLIYQTNKGMNVLLNDDDPQLVNTREWLIEAWPDRFAQWKGWLDKANRARVMELISA